MKIRRRRGIPANSASTGFTHFVAWGRAARGRFSATLFAAKTPAIVRAHLPATTRLARRAFAPVAAHTWTLAPTAAVQHHVVYARSHPPTKFAVRVAFAVLANATAPAVNALVAIFVVGTAPGERRGGAHQARPSLISVFAQPAAATVTANVLGTAVLTNRAAEALPASVALTAVRAEKRRAAFATQPFYAAVGAGVANCTARSLRHVSAAHAPDKSRQRT